MLEEINDTMSWAISADADVKKPVEVLGSVRETELDEAGYSYGIDILSDQQTEVDGSFVGVFYAITYINRGSIWIWRSKTRFQTPDEGQRLEDFVDRIRDNQATLRPTLD